MFIISKLLSALLLPPGLLIIVMLASLLLLVRRPALARGGLIFTTLALFFLSLSPVRDALILPLENYYPQPGSEALKPGMPIVILGGGIRPGYPEGAPDRTFVPGDALARLYHGFRLYRITSGKIYLTSGRVFHDFSEDSEARAMANALVGLGVNPSDLILEENSRNTYENASMTAARFPELAGAPFLLVTSAYHMPRAMMLFHASGLNPVAAATDYKSEIEIVSPWSILPHGHNFSDSCKALREYLGMAFYWLKIKLSPKVQKP